MEQVSEQPVEATVPQATIENQSTLPEKVIETSQESNWNYSTDDAVSPLAAEEQVSPSNIRAKIKEKITEKGIENIINNGDTKNVQDNATAIKEIGPNAVSDATKPSTPVKESVMAQMLSAISTPPGSQQEAVSVSPSSAPLNHIAQMSQGAGAVNEQGVSTLVQAPPAQTPLVQTPPAQTPLVQTPPAQTPLVQPPQVQTPFGSTSQKGEAPLDAKQHNTSATMNASAATTLIFNPNDGSVTTTNQANQLADGIFQENDSPFLVQNKYGQIITIEQSKDAVLTSSATVAATGNQLLHKESTNLDFNSRFIHSQLPNGSSDKVGATTASMTSNNEQSQSDLLSGNNQNFKNIPAFEQPGSLQDSNAQPSNASYLSVASQANTSQTTTTPLFMSATEGTMYQLGSGNLVPDTTVMDQMIAQFSTNKRLETGSVNLKLHPQELGELRMEIKVENDNVKAHIITQSPHAQEMIDRHMPKLREAMAQQGLHLDQVEITVADNDNAAGERFQNTNDWQHPQQFSANKKSQSEFGIELAEELVEAEDVNNNFNAIA